MNFNDIIHRLRLYLQPQGSLPVVKLFLNRGTYVDKECVYKAISEIEKKMLLRELDPMTNLERIGMMVLYDSAYMGEFLKEGEI